MVTNFSYKRKSFNPFRMKTKSTFIAAAILLCLLVNSEILGQSKKQERRLKKLTDSDRAQVLTAEENKRKESFPEPLATPYPANTLGELLQNQFMTQANGCGIVRTKSVNYIPRSVFNAYTDARLRNTTLVTVNVSAGNFLFLAMKESEKNTINSLTESSLVASRRVIGISDPFMPKFSEAIIQSPPGFPGFVEKKNCSGFFEASAGASVRAPFGELAASLQADASYSSSITLINAQFVSPLRSMLSEGGAQSVYTHLLLWQIYADDAINNPVEQDRLMNNAYYVSEFKGVAIMKASGMTQDAAISSKLNAGFSSNIFTASGAVAAGATSNSSFSLKDFTTHIFNPAINDTYIVSRLPSIGEINSKIQNAPNLEINPYKGVASSVLPFTIYRALDGIPNSLCEQSSWSIENWTTTQWVNAPTVSATRTTNPKTGLPQCVCQITGMIRATAIQSAANSNMTFTYDLVNSNSIGQNKLRIRITEPPVAVTTSPDFLYNDYAVNVLRGQYSDGVGRKFTWKIEGTISDDGVNIQTPADITDVQITYNNPAQDGSLSISHQPVNSKGVIFNIESQPFASTAQETGNEVSISITISFRVRLTTATRPKLTTRVITLKMPELI